MKIKANKEPDFMAIADMLSGKELTKEQQTEVDKFNEDYDRVSQKKEEIKKHRE